MARADATGVSVDVVVDLAMPPLAWGISGRIAASLSYRGKLRADLDRVYAAHRMPRISRY